MLRLNFQPLFFSLAEQEILNTWNILSPEIQTFKSKVYKKCLIVHVQCITISLVAKLKHTGVYSAGVFLQNATFRLNSCVYVLDYPPAAPPS